MDAKIHLEAGNLRDTIKEDTSTTSQDWVKAKIFIRRHLDEGLKSEYFTVEDSLTLWKTLKNRYNHQKTVILLRARYEWTHLKIQDFKTVAENNSAMFRISSQLKLCGETITEEDMLEKTSEQNNELLMKNHQSRPTGSAPFPEMNDDSLEGNTTSSRDNNYKRGHGHKCGGNGHWTRTCYTPKHLVDLYPASIKEKGVETNFLDQTQPMEIRDLVSNLSGQLNTTHLDVSDFISERGNEVYGSD
ncbi:uncharacterized protein LOC103964073 [Pyrus x bretschneideri]|uniref:uncharacterized protein LOC103964073 n=1 Tax=Pyrus x bretschneideri TaxID=225117 RepID=UPI00202DED6A|nr:uncharacterized protein LOC103964073 [Pyrus x bretschneideri]